MRIPESELTDAQMLFVLIALAFISLIITFIVYWTVNYFKRNDKIEFNNYTYCKCGKMIPSNKRHDFKLCKECKNAK